MGQGALAYRGAGDLHKPAGYECSAKPSTTPCSACCRAAGKCAGAIQPVGQLDEDTTGLLLLTDDGALIHRLTSPGTTCPRSTRCAAIRRRRGQLAALRRRRGARRRPAPVRAAAHEADGTYGLRLTLTEGRYHTRSRHGGGGRQPRRGLHRSAFGTLININRSAPNQWRWWRAAGAGPAAAAAIIRRTESPQFQSSRHRPGLR